MKKLNLKLAVSRLFLVLFLHHLHTGLDIRKALLYFYYYPLNLDCSQIAEAFGSLGKRYACHLQFDRAHLCILKKFSISNLYI